MNRKTEISERVLTLVKAAKNGDEDSVFQWLRGCRNEIDTCDDSNDKYNALHYASQKGHLGVLKMLLLGGADVNSRSGDCIEDEGEITFQPGFTPLMLAARYSHLETVELLLSAGADPQIRSDQEWTVLHAAVIGGKLAVVEKILSMKIDHSVMSYIRQCDEELGWHFLNTPMHAAASNGKSEIVECLLKHDVSPFECWVDKRTPIFHAAAYGHSEVIRVLCEHGVNPNSREERRQYGYFLDSTPLHYAALNGHVEAVKTLLSCGAEPRAIDSHMKQTPLEVAESSGHEEVARIIRAHLNR
jgi:ankyrin repeat protein